MAELRHKELKLERLRLRRIDRIFLRLSQGFLICSGIFLLAVWISYRPSLYITNIVVEGNRSVDARSVYDTVNYALREKLLLGVKRNNTYLYPAEHVELNIKDISPRIAYSHISFPDSHTLLASVAEYTPTFLYCRKTLESGSEASSSTDIIPRDCYFADETGYVFAVAPEYIGYPFIAIIASSTVEGMPLASPLRTTPVDAVTYKHIRTFTDRLSRAGFTTHAVTLMDGNDIRLSLDTPWTLLWTTTEDPDLTISNLQVLLTALSADKKAKAEVREIDLRFGNKIFYK